MQRSGLRLDRREDGVGGTSDRPGRKCRQAVGGAIHLLERPPADDCGGYAPGHPVERGSGRVHPGTGAHGHPTPVKGVHGFPGLRPKEWCTRAMVVGMPRRLRGERSCKQSLGQRAIRDRLDREIRQSVPLRVPPEEVVPELNGGDRCFPAGGVHLFHVHIAQPDSPDESALPDVVERTHRCPQIDAFARPVNVEDVQVLRSKAAQGSLQMTNKAVRRTHDGFRGDLDRISLLPKFSPERLTHELLRPPVAVCLGGIEVAKSPFPGATKHRFGRTRCQRAPIPLAQRPGAEAHRCTTGTRSDIGRSHRMHDRAAKG